MSTSFLEYYKVILKKVSFDEWLMLKEYFKACKLLNDDEKEALDIWLIHQKKQNHLFPLNLIQISKPEEAS